MMPVRFVLLLACMAILPGCVVASVAGAAVGTAVSVAGTAVETAVDATTTTQQEADEDRGKAIRLEEDRRRKAEEKAERDRKAAERDRRTAEQARAGLPLDDAARP